MVPKPPLTSHLLPLTSHLSPLTLLYHLDQILHTHSHPAIRSGCEMHGMNDVTRGVGGLSRIQRVGATEQAGQQQREFLNEMLLLCRVPQRHKFLGIRWTRALLSAHIVS